MRGFLVALLATAVVAPGAAASPAACTVLTDASGDAVVTGGPVTPAVADGQVDILSATVAPTRDGLAFTLTSQDLTEGRLGEWYLTFTNARRQTLLVAAGIGMWANAGSYEGVAGFRAGQEGRTTRVSGSVDYALNQIRVLVPMRAFGAAAPRRSERLNGFVLRAREVFVNADVGSPLPSQVGLSDTATSARSYVVGRGC